jgi:hypothetical protein
MLRFLWQVAAGYRLTPWRSPYLRWRMETFLGGNMEHAGPANSGNSSSFARGNCGASCNGAEGCAAISRTSQNGACFARRMRKFLISLVPRSAAPASEYFNGVRLT